MIVRLINKQGIWIPSPNIFFNIFDKTGLILASDSDRDIIKERLTEELEKDHNAWFFNVKMKFNVKSSKGSVPCDVRILKARKTDEDFCTGCIVFSTESDLAILKDFDFEFDESDMKEG